MTFDLTIFILLGLGKTILITGGLLLLLSLAYHGLVRKIR